MADVGVIECGGRFCLSPKTRFDLFVAEQVSGKELKSDRAFEVRVLRLVDDTHPALTELGEDLVVTDCGTDHDGSILSQTGLLSVTRCDEEASPSAALSCR